MLKIEKGIWDRRGVGGSEQSREVWSEIDR